MATAVMESAKPARSRAPDSYERALPIAAIALLAAVGVALLRGRAHWGEASGPVWVHLGTMIVALALTPALLLRRRGDMRHRWLGRIWVVALLATAAISFEIRSIGRGGFSVIHLLSLFVLFQAPLIWWSARTHRVALHRRAVRGMVTGALLVAGFFTFPFGRMLGRWLWG